VPTDKFINQRKNAWQRLEELLNLLDSASLRRLNREEVRELGRIYRENHKDVDRSRRIWQASLSQFRKTRTTEETEDLLLYAQMLINLAKLEEETGDYAKAADYLKDLLVVSPNKAALQKSIDALTAKAGPQK